MTMHENTYTGGRLQRIASLIKDGTHRVEAWGNHREGYEAYLVAVGSTAGVSISDRYSHLRTLRRDAKDQYGERVAVGIGRRW